MVPTNELEGYRKSAGKRRVLAAVAVVAALGAAAYLALRPADVRKPPEFELPLLSGGSLSSDELHGSPVVLNFFASWCAPCREEAPLLERTWRRYKDRGVRFVGVNIRDTRAGARRFVSDFDITYPVVVDADQRLVRKLGVYGLPQTFFINRRYELASVSSGERIGSQAGTTKLGAISAGELERNIERMLEDSDT